MSVLKECWSGIVGYTRSDTCINYDEAPANYSESKSGLYLDELKGINLKWTEDTGGYLWDKLANAYENAIRTFKIDVISEILKTHKQRYDPFIGNIGSQRFKTALNLTGNYAGVRMYCNDIKGAYFTLKAIGVLMNKTEVFDISIYDNLSETPIDIISVNSIANKISITNLSTPLVLNLSVDNYDNMEYFFIYDRGTKQPLDNKPTCGCGGVNWCFEKIKPCFADAKATKDRWRQWAMVGGIQGNDIAIREDWGVMQEMNGIVLIGEYNCDKFSYLCNDQIDYEVDELGQGIANAIAYKWGEFVMDYFLDTPEISRSTMLGVDALNNNRQYYNQRYAVMIDFIANNIDTQKYGCLSCRPVQGAKFNRQLL